MLHKISDIRTTSATLSQDASPTLPPVAGSSDNYATTALRTHPDNVVNAHASALRSPQNSNRTVMRLAPLQLTDAHCAAYVSGIRPMRAGTFYIQAEVRRDQLIVHDYGHGGSGWTLSFGSVQESLRYFDAALAQHPEFVGKPMCVVGAGVIGLMTAIALRQRGDVGEVTVRAEKFDELTSHRAGGLLAPISMKTSGDEAATVNRIAETSFVAWDEVANGRVPAYLDGARHMPLYVGETSDCGLDPYVTCGLIDAPRPVVVEFDPSTRHPMQAYQTIFMDPPKMMQLLTEQAVSLGVEFAQESLRNFSDVDERIVFNCAGMGAKALNNDTAMIPVQGHLLELRRQTPREYMVYTSAGTPSGSLYYMPKKGGTLGGTFIENEIDPTANPAEYPAILARGREFFGPLSR